MKDSFNELEREDLIKSIQGYLERPVYEGGVIVICGPRGAGKTRLVNQALNGERRTGWWDKLLGDGGTRKRLSRMRPPRGIHRQIIQVNVDPFFPHIYADKGNKKKSNKQSKDISTPTRALLRNLLFALTSNLDPNVQQRSSGRNLRARLGSLHYWLSPSALTLEQHRGDLRFRTIALWATLAASPFCSFIVGKPSLLLPLALLPAWMMLRARDWLAVARLNRTLYALAHADEVRESDDSKRKIEIGFQRKWGIAGLSLLLTSSGVALWLHPEWREEILLAITVFGGVLSLNLLRSRREKSHIGYGMDNLAWPLTLLRRYLFLLHRCGIEPVLVLDELDKLEPGGLDTGGEEGCKYACDCHLDDLLAAMLRLKQAMGAEFFWVLVGNTGLYERIANARAAKAQAPHKGMAPLATLSQVEFCLGPIGYSTTRKYLGDLKLPRKLHGLAWLVAGGVYSNLRRIAEERGASLPGDLDQASRISTRLDDLWDSPAQAICMSLGQDHPHRHLLASDWNQIWIRTGLLQYGREILYGTPASLSEIENQILLALGPSLPVPAHFELTALASGRPAALVELGRYLAAAWSHPSIG